jgi:tetratricopeptide (TPR) repeat protein
VFELKAISAEAIPVALAKAERYRLLDEPAQAESICQDILQIDPNNQQALVTLILSITDQMESNATARQAQKWLSRLNGEYERSYYAGIIAERLGYAYIRQQGHGFGFQAYECFREAMVHFEKAEALQPPGNDDAILRWNACARTLNGHSELRPRPEESYEPIIGE